MINIAELRMRKGKMTQAELAKEINVSTASISQWEKHPLTMSSKSIIKICQFFNVTADELLGIKKEG